MSITTRFWAKVQKTAGCWLWTSSLDTYGYGQMLVAGSLVLAHRLSWSINVGRIPKGKHVLHTCDNPRCVNPAHLFLGTHADNMIDMAKKARNSSFLTPSDIKIIRQRGKAGELQRIIANDYGVHQRTISRILLRQVWKYV